MERVIRLKRWALYGAVLAMGAVALFIFLSAGTGDSSDSDYHGIEGGPEPYVQYSPMDQDEPTFR